MPLPQMKGSPLQDALEYVDLEENFAIQQSKKRKGNVYSSGVVYKISVVVHILLTMCIVVCYGSTWLCCYPSNKTRFQEACCSGSEEGIQPLWVVNVQKALLSICFAPRSHHVSLQLHCSSSTINMEGGTWGQAVLLCGYSACVILMHVLACGESVCRACV